MPEPLRDAVLDKIHEQTERLTHLIALVPAEWPPDALLGHLLECLAGFCAVLYAALPDRLPHFLRLREQPVNHECSAAEARQRLAVYQAHIDEGFALLSDEDLARKIATVFTPAGEPLLTLLLGNLEHVINHKHELFTRLKQAGIAVATPDLYCFRA